MDKQNEAVEAGAFLSTKSIKDAPSAFTASLLASRYPSHVTLISLPERASQKRTSSNSIATSQQLQHTTITNHNNRLGYQYSTYFPRISTAISLSTLEFALLAHLLEHPTRCKHQSTLHSWCDFFVIDRI